MGDPIDPERLRTVASAITLSQGLPTPHPGQRSVAGALCDAADEIERLRATNRTLTRGIRKALGQLDPRASLTQASRQRRDVRDTLTTALTTGGGRA